MLRSLCFGPLNAFSPCVSTSDHRTAHTDWRAVHQRSAKQVLEAVRHAGQHSAATRYFEPAGVSGPGVQSLLSLAPRTGADDRQIPVGPQLMLLTCPTSDGAELQDLMHLLRERQVHHLLTLGEVPVMWLSTMQSMHPIDFRRTFSGAVVALSSSNPQAQGDGAWTSTLKLSEQQPHVSAVPQASSATVHHELERLHVAAEQPGLLDPAALQMLAQWLRTAVPAGAPVAVIADGPLLHGMTGQLAMTQALLQQQPAVTAHDKHGKRQRNELLTDIAAQLNWLDKRYVAGKDHLSAVMEAHRTAPITAHMEGPASMPDRRGHGMDRGKAAPSLLASIGSTSLHHRPRLGLPQAVVQELQQRQALRSADKPAATTPSRDAAPEWDTQLEDPDASGSDFDSSSTWSSS